MRASRVYAARARRHLREHGLQAHDVAIVPAAAGGPKGLVLNALDRYLFGTWLRDTRHVVHLLGASIGVWRMACACRSDPDAALAEMADSYIHQRYEHAPGKAPQPSHVSAVFGAKLAERFGGHEAEVLSSPRYRLHVFTSRGRRLLHREGRWRTPLGYLAAFAANSVSRSAMATWLERVIFSDPREPLPIRLHDYRTHQVALDADNLAPAILASCSIAFWLDAVRDIPGEPTGAYWDGGITDYHLHLDYASIGERLVVYPHFQKAIVPGWLDKALKHRHRASARLDNVVVLAPDPEWIATLPNAKLPDRGDFKRYGDDFDARVAAWSRATAESRRLADEFAEMVNRAGGIDAESLERALEVLLEVVAAPLSRVCIRSTRSCVLSAQTPRPVSDARPSRFGIDRSTRRMRPIMKRNRSQAHRLLPIVAALAATAAGLGISPADASSHREAPFITTVPKVDATDLYLFNSYEAGRDGYVTVLANYQPLQAPYGGPNYFKMDPNALYEIHIDNNGDAKEDITLQFRFKNKFNAIALDVGGKQVAIPLTQAGAVTGPNSPSLNVNEQYSVDIVRGDRRTGQRASITNMSGGSSTFDKPVDNIGTKTIPNYGAYADQHVYNVNIPGCTMPAKLFVGQRKDPFAVNLGVIFDLVNAPLAVITDPTLIGAAPNTIDDANVTTLGLEVHKSCLLAAGAADPVIGAWTTASLRQGQLLDPTPRKGHQTTAVSGGAWTQVSRLAMPLVNEVVIGLPDKDRFNGSKPKDDAQFADYVTNPTLPKLIEIAQNIPGAAPTNLPRTDLVTTFLTGIAGVNKPLNVVPSEMMRLNTAIPAVPFAQQNRLGIVGNILAGGNDNAGYPNGRRPKDDVVDISLVAVMGGLCVANGDTNALGFGAACKPSAVPLGATAFKLHDAVDQATAPFLSKFPYLFTPLPGATN